MGLHPGRNEQPAPLSPEAEAGDEPRNRGGAGPSGRGSSIRHESGELEAVDAVLQGIEGDPEAVIRRLLVQRGWSGRLPPPDVYAQYPLHVQERMLLWNDASTIDESRRQDKLVEAEVREAKIGPWRTSLVFLICLAAAVYCVAAEDSVVGAALFLSVPVMMFLSSQATTYMRDRSNENGDS